MLPYLLARSLLIGLIAAGMGLVLARGRRLGILALLPLFTPALLPAYVYPHLLPGLLLPSARVEAVYMLLCALRFAPLAFLIVRAVPSRHAGAAHSAKLLGAGPGFRLVAWWHGDGLAFRAGFALTALLAFDEFDLASFFPARSWTVPLFDAHAGGLPLVETFRRVLPVLIFKFPLWLLLLATLRRLHQTVQEPIPPPPARSMPALALAIPAVLIFVFIPLAVVLGQARQALLPLFAESALWRETATSLLLAGCSAGLSLTVAALLRPTACWVLGLLTLLPGVLPLGLVLLRLQQMEPWWRLADTPLPLVLGWSLWLFPGAVLVQFLLRRGEDTEALHSARLLPGWTGRRLVLHLRAPAWLAGGLGLAALAAPELTLSSLLAAPAWPTAATRLYNFMHYGQSARLAAMLLLAMLAPLLAAIPLLSFLGARRHG